MFKDYFSAVASYKKKSYFHYERSVWRQPGISVHVFKLRGYLQVAYVTRVLRRYRKHVFRFAQTERMRLMTFDIAAFFAAQNCSQISLACGQRSTLPSYFNWELLNYMHIGTWSSTRRSAIQRKSWHAWKQVESNRTNTQHDVFLSSVT